jgi:hypothetical protein
MTAEIVETHTFCQRIGLCLSARQVTPATLAFSASLPKNIFFFDETVTLEFEVDNSQSERDVLSMDVYFRQVIDYKKRFDSGASAKDVVRQTYDLD